MYAGRIGSDMGNCACINQECQSPVTINRSEAGDIIVRHGGRETYLQNRSVVEVVYDYHQEEVRFVTLAEVVRHPMRAAALDNLDTAIKDYIPDIFVD